MQLSPILDKIPLGIIIFNELNHIIYTNHAGQTYFEETNNNLLEVIKGIVFATFEKNQSVEKIIKYSNNDSLLVWRIKTELLEYSSLQVMVIIQDETVKSQLEQTVIKAEKLAVVGQLAIGSLVEMRNPLTSARGFCQLIQENSDYQQEYIEIIAKEIEQLQKIIKNCTSMFDTSKFSNLEAIYKKILFCVYNQINSYRLIMVTDAFDNVVVNIAEEHVNTIMTKVVNLLKLWIEENVYIIINGELAADHSYVNLKIQAYCDIKKGEYKSVNLQSVIENLGGRNNQVEVHLLDNNTIAVEIHLPVIIPQYYKDKLKKEHTQTLG